MIWMQQVWRNKGAELYLTATGERDVYQFKSIILTIKLEKLSFFHSDSCSVVQVQRKCIDK